MIAMNIRKHISHRRQSERVISMRHKRILSLEINRKLSLQDIATRNIDKQMENIQKELTEMRNPSRSRQRKKQYKFPVTSPVWKRNKPPQGTPGNNTRRDVLLLKSFDDDDDDDDDDSNDDEDSIKQRDAYRRWSTSETLLLFNNDDQNDNTAAFSRKNSQLIPSKESTHNPNSILINSNLMSFDNKTDNIINFKQTENLIGLSNNPSCQSGIMEKPLVIFSPEKTSTIVGQFIQGNNAAKKAKDIGNLQPVTEELPQSGTLLPLPPVRHDGAAAAVIELPEQSPPPTRTFGLKSTADVCTSLPVAITQEGKQQANGYLQNNLIVGDGRETDRNRRGKNPSHHNNNYSGEASEADPNNSVSNSQHESLFAGNPDFATLARTSMSSIKKDIARRLSSTAVPTGLNKLQCQKNSGTMPKNRLNPEQSSYKNALPGSGSNQLLVPRRENDKRRKSEGGEILGATASVRRMSLYTPREPHTRQEMPNAVVTTKSPELDTGLRVNKPKEEKPRRKSYLKSLPVYDRELYNPDGSLRTVYCLPSFNESWQQAQQARYIRTRESMDRDKELSVEEVFAKHENKNTNTGTEESGTEKQMQ